MLKRGDVAKMPAGRGHGEGKVEIIEINGNEATVRYVGSKDKIKIYLGLLVQDTETRRESLNRKVEAASRIGQKRPHK